MCSIAVRTEYQTELRSKNIFKDLGLQRQMKESKTLFDQRTGKKALS